MEWEVESVKISVDVLGIRECMESSSFQDIQTEAAGKLSRWDNNMENAEKVVYSSFLVSAAREAEIGSYRTVLTIMSAIVGGYLQGLAREVNMTQ